MKRADWFRVDRGVGGARRASLKAIKDSESEFLRGVARRARCEIMEAGEGEEAMAARHDARRAGQGDPGSPS